MTMLPPMIKAISAPKTKNSTTRVQNVVAYTPRCCTSPNQR